VRLGKDPIHGESEEQQAQEKDPAARRRRCRRMSRGKKEKEPKRKKKGLWKMTPLWESKRRGFPQRFGKACWLFHISAQGPVADEPLTINQRRGSLLLDQGGSVLRCQNDSRGRESRNASRSSGVICWTLLICS